MTRKELLEIMVALALGAGFWFILGLRPVWWLAWIVPGLVFAMALRTQGWTSRGLVAIAALIGSASNLAYLVKVMPLYAALLCVLLQALLWVFVIGTARRVVQAWESAWTVLALPVMAVAIDTLLAHFTPDGNFISLAYSQADVLPVSQLASIAGVGGILFLLMLVNSALALGIVYRTRLEGALAMYPAVAVVLALSLGFGFWRLEAKTHGEAVSFGIAAVDDFIDGKSGDRSREVWEQYRAQVTELAGSGAKFVLLPEKIIVLPAAEVARRQAWLAALAREQKVWLVAGIGVDTGKERRNEAWWFSPDGELVTNYLKHFMAPPEREFVAGHEFPVNDVGGVRYGVAICKDMHFASLGREFGRRHARVMLVPAWDFDDDAEYAANITRLRGVESGFMIVRSSRNGLLTVTDPYGRVLAVNRSAKLPGTTLFTTVIVGPSLPTMYVKMGDWLGFVCVLAAIGMYAAARWEQRRMRVIAELHAEEEKGTVPDS